MRTDRALIFSLLFFAASSVFAQTDSLKENKTSIHYFNSFLSGGLIGDQQKITNLTFNTTHGVRWKRLALGMSAGYDSYTSWRVMPYYGSVSFDFGDIKGNALFVELGLGHAKTWHVGPTEWLAAEYTSDGGRSTLMLIGYRISGNKFNLYFKAGYKFQRINYHYKIHYEGWGGHPGWTYRYSVEQDIERLALLIGFGW